MAWHTGDLRAEVAAEFSAWSDKVVLQHGPVRHADVRHYYRPIWTRPPIQCRTCGVRFTPIDARRLYCTRRCLALYHASRSKQAWHDRRSAARLAARANRVCANPRCGITFTGRRSDTRYCEPACRERCKSLRYLHKVRALRK